MSLSTGVLAACSAESGSPDHHHSSTSPSPSRASPTSSAPTHYRYTAAQLLSAGRVLMRASRAKQVPHIARVEVPSDRYGVVVFVPRRVMDEHGKRRLTRLYRRASQTAVVVMVGYPATPR